MGIEPLAEGAAPWCMHIWLKVTCLVVSLLRQVLFASQVVLQSQSSRACGSFSLFCHAFADEEEEDESSEWETDDEAEAGQAHAGADRGAGTSGQRAEAKTWSSAGKSGGLWHSKLGDLGERAV